MFKLQPKPTFWAKVPLSIPGEAKPAEIDVEFKWLGKAALKTYFEGLADKEDVAALGEIVNDWKGPDAPYTQENLGRLLDAYPASAMELFDAFRREQFEAKEKNSRP